MNDIVSKVECNDQIIQVKLLNVEKNILFVGDIFKEIADHQVNIDMISQIMLEDEIRIDFTCQMEDQHALNQAIECIKKNHPRIMIFQNRKVAKISVEGKGMKEAVGVASHIFDIYGRHQVPVYQITTSDISISYVIDKEYMDLIVSEIKKDYQL